MILTTSEMLFQLMSPGATLGLTLLVVGDYVIFIYEQKQNKLSGTLIIITKYLSIKNFSQSSIFAFRFHIPAFIPEWLKI